MKETNDEDLKLIYVLKIGYNSKYEGLYEFIFSTDETNIDIINWGWDQSPACNNAQPPEDSFINKIINLKTNSFDLFCLHEAVDREYMHGYHNIHALAYEIEKQQGENENYNNDYEENDNDELPLLVFHYGMSLKEVSDIFYERNIIRKKDEFVEAANIKLI